MFQLADTYYYNAYGLLLSNIVVALTLGIKYLDVYIEHYIQIKKLII